MKERLKKLFLNILGCAFLFGPIYIMGFVGRHFEKESFFFILTLVGTFEWGSFLVHMLNRRCEECKEQEKKKSGKKKDKV